jgi:predicted nucleic acid-binding protein
MEEFAIKSGIDMPDALIAATASETPLPLSTGNYKDYKGIPDIELSVFKYH